MKRIAFLMLSLCLAATGIAQNAAPQTNTDDTTSHSKISLDLGFSAGFNTPSLSINNDSPYRTIGGVFFQIPLRLRYTHNEQWSFAASLRYDFEWNLMYYHLATIDDGISHLSEPTTVTQHAIAYNSYLALPLEVQFKPWPTTLKTVSLKLDITPAYNVKNHITLHNHETSDLRVKSGAQPWKFEVGLTFNILYLGIIHGTRLFANLLPSYIDPLNGNKIYSTGIQIFF